jgi:hypothetical protein
MKAKRKSSVISCGKRREASPTAQGIKQNGGEGRDERTA